MERAICCQTHFTFREEENKNGKSPVDDLSLLARQPKVSYIKPNFLRGHVQQR